MLGVWAMNVIQDLDPSPRLVVGYGPVWTWAGPIVFGSTFTQQVGLLGSEQVAIQKRNNTTAHSFNVIHSNSCRRAIDVCLAICKQFKMFDIVGKFLDQCRRVHLVHKGSTNTVTKWHASVQWLIGLQWGVQLNTQVHVQSAWSTHPFLIGLPQLACNYLSTKSIKRMVVYMLLVCDSTYAVQAFQRCIDWQHCNSFVK